MAEANGSPTSGRFIPLSTHHLTSEPPLSETTLPSLLERSEQLAAEAREALPYSFDKCTYDSGYLRQSVWSCVDCGEKGVCYGCSISCHAGESTVFVLRLTTDHKLVELWTKRHFRCDCPTTAMPLVHSKRKKCTLNPPHAQPQPPNDENKYGSTFAGKFCRCGRDYDPETEVEAMVTCIACEVGHVVFPT
jgi:E3 ubiquitin-protein ligase UBR7